MTVRACEFAPPKQGARKARFELVCMVLSKSTPDKLYAIKRHVDTGQLSCACPAWRFMRASQAEKTCKHLQALRTAQAMPGSGFTVRAPLLNGRPIRRLIELED